jgi:hypothetical protein
MVEPQPADPAKDEKTSQDGEEEPDPSKSIYHTDEVEEKTDDKVTYFKFTFKGQKMDK